MKHVQIISCAFASKQCEFIAMRILSELETPLLAEFESEKFVKAGCLYGVDSCSHSSNICSQIFCIFQFNMHVYGLRYGLGLCILSEDLPRIIINIDPHHSSVSSCMCFER